MKTFIGSKLEENLSITDRQTDIMRCKKDALFSYKSSHRNIYLITAEKKQMIFLNIECIDR